MAGLEPTVSFEATYDPEVAILEGDAGEMSVPFNSPQKEQAFVGINEATQEVFANGRRYHIDDHQGALDAEQYLDQPREALPAGYRPIGPDEYKDYIMRIKDPTLGRLAKKNFGVGVDNLQLLGGYGMQLAGAEETGQAVVEQQVEDLRKNQPYQRTFTEDAASDPIGWFVANLAQQGPNLIESALAAIAGAGVGAAMGGNPFTAIGGMMMTLGSKGAVKKALIEIAKKKMAGESLEAAEMKALREAASGAYAFNMKGAAKEVLGEFNATAAKAGGAAIGSVGSNYAIGAADVYGEQIDSGTPNRAEALGLAVPYALMESLPELVGFGYFAKGAKVPWKGNKLRRGKEALGATALGATGEGLTEAGQESLLIGGANEEMDILSSEGIHRLVNSFAAGAGVGGALGGGASVLRRAQEEGKPKRDLKKPNLDLLGNEERLAIEDGRDMGNLGNMIEQEERPLLEDQREMGNLGNELEGPGPVPLLEGPEYGGMVNEIVQQGNRDAQATGGPLNTPDVINIPPEAGPAIGVAPVDDTQRDPAVIRSQAFDEYEQQQAGQYNDAVIADNQAQIDAIIQAQNAEVMQQPADTGMGQAMQQAQAQQAAQQAAQQQAVAAQQQSAIEQQQMEARFDAAQATPMPTQQTQIPPNILVPPAHRGEAGITRKVKPNRDEPTLLVDTEITDGPQAGQIIQYPAPVAEVYDASRKEIEALQKLAKCLGGGGT